MNFSKGFFDLYDVTDTDYEYENYDTRKGYSYDHHLLFFLTTSIVSKYFCGLLSTLGILGNIATIIVLVKHGSFSDTTNVLLTSIAVCDLIYLLADFIMEWHRVLMRIDVDLGQQFENIFLKSYAPIHNIALIIGILQVAVIAVERFFAVLYPFTVSRIFTPFHVRVITICSVLYTIAFTLPNYLLVNHNVILHGDEDNFTGHIYFWVIISTVFLYMVPMFIILFSNIAIGIRIQISSANIRFKKSVTGSSKRQKEIKLFKMLFIVCCVSFLSFFPRIILALCFLLDFGLSFNYRNIIFDTCFHIYASSNFIIYISMSSKFAKAFKLLVCGKQDGV